MLLVDFVWAEARPVSYGVDSLSNSFLGGERERQRETAKECPIRVLLERNFLYD